MLIVLGSLSSPIFGGFLYFWVPLWFLSPTRKVIEVKIIDDEEYEKNKAFAIELGEPVLLEIGQKHGGWVGGWVWPNQHILRPLNTPVALTANS